MHADGEVVHDPQRHPGRDRLRLRGGELLVELPLQPAMEIHCGRMLSDELGDAVVIGMAHRLGPLVYFGFGSTPIAYPADTVAAISAACAQLGERALIWSGPNDFTHVPHAEHAKLVDTVGLAAIFPACRAVVHHGGAGTTAAGLRAGIPALVLWNGLDQPVWADTVTRLKVGFGRSFSESTVNSLVATCSPSLLRTTRVEPVRSRLRRPHRPKAVPVQPISWKTPRDAGVSADRRDASYSEGRRFATGAPVGSRWH